MYERTHNPKKTKEHGQFRSRFLERLNMLFVSSGMQGIATYEVRKYESGYSMTITFNDATDFPIEIGLMGSGITELIITLAKLISDEVTDSSSIYFLEEPEAHLHPSLFKRFLTHILSYRKNQYFITTHSSVPLDMMNNESNIYHCRFEQGKGSIIQVADTNQRLNDIMDSLGISGSLLLQANCILWVEGPTDRIYIRHWLNAYARKNKDTHPQLIEGSDYSFVLYGGKLLSSLTLSDDDDSGNDLFS